MNGKRSLRSLNGRILKKCHSMPLRAKARMPFNKFNTLNTMLKVLKVLKMLNSVKRSSRKLLTTN